MAIEMKDKAWRVYVCQGSKCKKKKDEFLKPFGKALKKEGLKGEVRVQKTDCNGHCKCAPVVGVEPGGKWYGQADPFLAVRLVGEIKVRMEEEKAAD